MDEKTKDTEETETQPATVAPAKAAPPQDEPGEDDKHEEPARVEVNVGLLDDLPLPAFQRIAVLPVGGHVAAVENSRRSLMFVRGAPLLYAAGIVAKTKATDKAGELRLLAELCREGRGGDVFSLADLVAAKLRRFEGKN